jgi:hypothetical protein
VEGTAQYGHHRRVKTGIASSAIGDIEDTYVCHLSV